MTTDTRSLEERRQHLRLWAAIAEAEWHALARLEATLPDGGQVWVGPSGRRWLVWEHGERREAMPLPDR